MAVTGTLNSFLSAPPTQSWLVVESRPRNPCKDESGNASVGRECRLEPKPTQRTHLNEHRANEDETDEFSCKFDANLGLVLNYSENP